MISADLRFFGFDERYRDNQFSCKNPFLDANYEDIDPIIILYDPDYYFTLFCDVW